MWEYFLGQERFIKMDASSLLSFDFSKSYVDYIQKYEYTEIKEQPGAVRLVIFPIPAASMLLQRRLIYSIDELTNKIIRNNSNSAKNHFKYILAENLKIHMKIVNENVIEAITNICSGSEGEIAGFPVFINFHGRLFKTDSSNEILNSVSSMISFKEIMKMPNSRNLLRLASLQTEERSTWSFNFWPCLAYRRAPFLTHTRLRHGEERIILAPAHGTQGHDRLMKAIADYYVRLKFAHHGTCASVYFKGGPILFNQEHEVSSIVNNYSAWSPAFSAELISRISDLGNSINLLDRIGEYRGFFPPFRDFAESPPAYMTSFGGYAVAISRETDHRYLDYAVKLLTLLFLANPSYYHPLLNQIIPSEPADISPFMTAHMRPKLPFWREINGGAKHFIDYFLTRIENASPTESLSDTEGTAHQVWKTAYDLAHTIDPATYEEQLGAFKASVCAGMDSYYAMPSLAAYRGIWNIELTENSRV